MDGHDGRTPACVPDDVDVVDAPGEEHTSQTGLTLAAIIDTATAIADERGDTAVPLRAIGKRLGCSAMALYTYVDGKDELLDLMYDRPTESSGRRPRFR